MGHDRRSSVAQFLVSARVAPGEMVSLDGDATHHVRVLRLVEGNRVGLTDGLGQVAVGVLTTVTRASSQVRVDEVTTTLRPYPIHLLVPVADRERMLWLAEKVVELQAASWQPVHWRRSTSVSTRGTGAAFTSRVIARMQGALTQSRGSWLPEVREAADVEQALEHVSSGAKLVLDPDGVPLLALAREGAAPTVTIAVGPEGGFEETELAQLVTAGFVRATLGDTILRFETAAVAALAIVRAATAAARP